MTIDEMHNEESRVSDASIKSELLKAARGLENRFVSLNVNDPDVTNIFAQSISFIEKMASTYEEPEVSSQSLEELAELASAFDLSGDPELQAEASAIDQVLLALAAPGEAVTKINLVYDKELEELRKTRRSREIEKKYSNPRKELQEMHGHRAIADAVDKNVRRYRSMEAPLSTRYSPDRPGVSLMRITDGVYQDPTTGKTYDYRAGYTTDKGNEIPGGSVDQQIPDLNDHQSRSLFTTREGLTSSASRKEE